MTVCNGSHDDGIADGNPTRCSAASGCGRSGCSSECRAGVSAVTARVNLDSSHLSAACDALNEIMQELYSRRLLSGKLGTVIRHALMPGSLETKTRTDEELENIASRAYEDAAAALASVGRDGP